MPHLEKRRKLWVVVHAEGVGRGAKRTVSPGYALKADAKAHCDRLCAAKAARKKIKPGTLLTWAELIERWLVNRKKRGAYPGDYEDKARRQFTALGTAHGWKDASQVKPAQVEVLRIGDRRMLVGLLHFAKREKQPIDLECLDTEPPPRPRKAKAPLLTERQVAVLLAEAALVGGPHAAAFGHLLVTYGHRPESLVKLTVASVDLEAKTLSLPVKGGDRIQHPILAATVAFLCPLVAGRLPMDPLFLDQRTGKAWPSGQRFADWWWRQVAPVLKVDALRGVYHLKRYAITGMLDLHLDVATIASITGHRTPSQLLTYNRTNETRQNAAIKALGAIRGHNKKS